MAFENLNSLETLSIQNNKLTTIPEEVMEPIIDTLRVVDIMGEIDCSVDGWKLLFCDFDSNFTLLETIKFRCDA
jgi:Leucine-rich repeat (LRR) protein